MTKNFCDICGDPTKSGGCHCYQSIPFGERWTGYNSRKECDGVHQPYLEVLTSVEGLDIDSNRTFRVKIDICPKCMASLLRQAADKIELREK